MIGRRLAAAGTLAIAVVLAYGLAAEAAEIKVLAAIGMADVLKEVSVQFGRTTGHKLTLQFDAPAFVKRSIDSGETFDLTILTPALMDDLAKQGKIITGTRADIARDGIGVAVRSGAPKLDVGSVDAFKRALLNAKSVAIVEGGAAGPVYFTGVFERLGIAQEMKPKIKLQPTPVRALQAVADDEAELGLVITFMIGRARGVELAGPLPSELQYYIVFTAAVGTNAKEPDGAKELIRYLTGPEATSVIKAKGLEPR